MDRLYFDCDIESGCIYREFPWEFLREFKLPGVGCQVSNHMVNEFAANFLYGASGKLSTPITAGSIITEISKTIPLTQTLKCQLLLQNDVGHGVWKIEYNHGDLSLPGIVSSSPKCDCLLIGGFNPKVNWSKILELKYESPYTAACLVGFFFLRRLNYMPIDITCGERDWDSCEYKTTLFDGFRAPMNSDRAVVVLHYHKKRGDSTRQLLKVRMNKTNGGWNIEDPINKQSRLQRKKCFKCNHHNIDQKDYRVMFGLDCGRHTVCEDCVFHHFGRKTSNEYAGNDQNYCQVCKCHTRSVVSVSLDGVSEMKSPIPIGFIGLKPVFNPFFLKEYGGFYKLHIEWIVLAHAKAVKDFNCLVNRMDNSCNELRLMRSDVTATVNDWYRLTQRIHKEKNARRLLNEVKVFTGGKMYMVEWTMEFDVAYPMEFLQQNRCMYESRLNRNYFNISKRRADISMSMISI